MNLLDHIDGKGIMWTAMPPLESPFLKSTSASHLMWNIIPAWHRGGCHGSRPLQHDCTMLFHPWHQLVTPLSFLASISIEATCVAGAIGYRIARQLKSHAKSFSCTSGTTVSGTSIAVKKEKLWAVLFSAMFIMARACHGHEVRSEGIAEISSNWPDNTVKSLTEGYQDFTIVCNVTKNNLIWRTDWYIRQPNSLDPTFKQVGLSSSGMVEWPTDLVNKVVVSSPLQISGTSGISAATEFLIKNFTRSFHLTKLQCGTLNTRRTFILGIEVAPKVQNHNSTVMEGSNVSITLDLILKDLSVFPPIIENLTSWKYEGEEIMPSEDISISRGAAGNYYINFTSISRDRAGTYSLTVSNGVNESTGYYELGIYHLVKAASSKLSEVMLGANVTLVAFGNSSGIDGWPTPQVSWIHPDGHYINTSTGRYNIDIFGELSISNVTLSDNGTYICELYNDEKKVQTIEHWLIVKVAMIQITIPKFENKGSISKDLIIMIRSGLPVIFFVAAVVVVIWLSKTRKKNFVSSTLNNTNCYMNFKNLPGTNVHALCACIIRPEDFMPGIQVRARIREVSIDYRGQQNGHNFSINQYSSIN